MEELFKDSSERILIYTSVETILDPDDLNVSHEVLNSLPIDAIVTDVSGESMKWRTDSIITSDSKQLICEAKHKNLIKMSYKIEIDGEEFVGYKRNGTMSIKQIGNNYIRVYAYLNK